MQFPISSAGKLEKGRNFLSTGAILDVRFYQSVRRDTIPNNPPGITGPTTWSRQPWRGHSNTETSSLSV